MNGSKRSEDVMRREAGALILIVAVLSIRLPAMLSGDHHHPAQPAVNRTAASSPAETGWKNTGPAPPAPLQGQDSIRYPAPAARPSGPARPVSDNNKITPKHPQPLPSGFFADPLRYLSTTSPESLTALPGIGPVLAERIAKAASGKGPFTHWDDLLAVKGIGPKKLDKLKRFATGQ
jgi:predicted flap endonuclease-1-like 5' DNA nuclease